MLCGINEGNVISFSETISICYVLFVMDVAFISLDMGNFCYLVTTPVIPC